MKSYFLKNARIINEDKILQRNVLIVNDKIEEVLEPSLKIKLPDNCIEMDLQDKFLLPGIIDDQVHFRDPGLTDKADIETESRAAVAGGVTSFMDMPNTIPNVLTQEVLEDKYKIGAQKSLANFSFYMGVSNDNVKEVLKTNPKNVCGIKVFLGASTGNMLVDKQETLEEIFKKAPTLVAVHCEDEPIVQANLQVYKEKFGEDIPVEAHPLIRSREACYKSSSFAVDLAKKFHTRLHVLHLSTADEMQLFNNDKPLEEKMITAEVCVHHLWFSDKDYAKKGSLIRWNPAIKTQNDANQLLQALLDERIDVVATDHAPHQYADKKKKYLNAPSGAPMIQHSLVTMLEMVYQSKISYEKVVEKMCHNPARLFRIENRGYIRKGYYADLVVVDSKKTWKVESENIHYKCGWSPLEGQEFHHQVAQTFVNGRLVYNEGIFDETIKGKRLTFNR